MSVPKSNMTTLQPSLLPQRERIDFFKFLIDNRVPFKREPNGEYSAIIHLLNPKHYTPDLKEKPQSNQSKPQSPSSIAPLTNIKPMKKTTSESSLLLHRSDSDSHFLHCKRFTKLQAQLKQSNTSSNFSSQRIQSYTETFSRLYPAFYNEVKPMIGIRGKKCSVYQLKLFIEELYAIRFIHDTTLIKTQLSKASRNMVDLSHNNPFYLLVYQFIANKYAKKPAIDQWALNMLLTIEHFKGAHKEIELFSKLLSEEYDNDDMVLMLFMRYCIEKEAKVVFYDKAQNEMALQHMEHKDHIDTEVYLSLKSCQNIASMLFGNEEPALIKAFIKRIEEKMDKGTNCIGHSELLALVIEDYHQGRGKGKKKEEKPIECSKAKLTISGDSDFFSDDYSDYENNQVNRKPNQLLRPQTFPNSNPQLIKHSNEDQLYRNTQLQHQQEKDSPSEFYKALVCFYHNESKTNQSYPKHKALITDFLYSYIQEKEINIFFSKLFTYDSNDPLIITKLAQIKQLILTKISLLINIIASSDKAAWHTSLKILPADKVLSNEHFDFLTTLFTNITANPSISSIPEKAVEKFSSELLTTQELMAQITKVIENNF